jgi:hypothetical protein
MGQRNPKHQLIGGKHPMIYRVSTCFNHPLGGAGLLPSTVESHGFLMILKQTLTKIPGAMCPTWTMIFFGILEPEEFRIPEKSHFLTSKSEKCSPHLQ